MEESDELFELVRLITTVVLDEETIPTWSVTSGQYYAKLAQRVCHTDEQLVHDIKNVVSQVRTKYRSFIEYSHRVASISIEKSPQLDESELCCVCLQQLDGNWQRVLRLRTLDNDPSKCGHRIHKACAMRIHESVDGHVHCPMCREVLGPQQWFDTESKRPSF